MSFTSDKKSRCVDGKRVFWERKSIFLRQKEVLVTLAQRWHLPLA